jgi:hypothetical protein
LNYRYTIAASYATLTDIQKQTLQTLITGSGQAIPGGNPNVVVLKLYLSSMENTRIYNFPQPGLQVKRLYNNNNNNKNKSLNV